MFLAVELKQNNIMRGFLHKPFDELYSLSLSIKHIQIGWELAELWNAIRDMLEKLISQNVRLFITKGK
jgi:hypothetical protein